MTRLLLVRHGETEFNSVGRIQGHTDIDLSTKGIRQVELLADYLADEPIDVIYSSDLRRAARSAEIIASRLGKKVITRPELREINYGRPWAVRAIGPKASQWPLRFRAADYICSVSRIA